MEKKYTLDTNKKIGRFGMNGIRRFIRWFLDVCPDCGKPYKITGCGTGGSPHYKYCPTCWNGRVIRDS